MLDTYQFKDFEASTIPEKNLLGTSQLAKWFIWISSFSLEGNTMK